MFFTVNGISQIRSGDPIHSDDGRSIKLGDIGITRIILKDGRVKKNCEITEIGSVGIVYIKDKVLHDMQIEKIAQIEFKGGNWAIVFNEKNQPKVTRIYE